MISRNDFGGRFLEVGLSLCIAQVATLTVFHCNLLFRSNREKVTIFLLVSMFSVGLVGLVGFWPAAACHNQEETITARPLWKEPESTTTSIFGRLYETNPWGQQHPGSPDLITKQWGEDSSGLFPRIPVSQLPTKCINSAKNNTIQDLYATPGCPANKGDEYCHSWIMGSQAVQAAFQPYARGFVPIAASELGKDGMTWVKIRDKVYNLTQYVQALG